ncbi:hypothetical protein L195_g026276 [Trifolium pratense]|uniref:Uncharacterized protein n=1 Tax=Trifolium pratense TaxID=57577 RepID=A0A2K3NIU0_TRIPR|nr:hypothetical protein L195_g026276 [Trifolium pratense]
MYVEVLENIHINAPLSEVPHKKRKSEDDGTRKIISNKKGRVAFQVVDVRTEPKPVKLILRIEPEPPPHVQDFEPTYKRKKGKGSSSSSRQSTIDDVLYEMRAKNAINKERDGLFYAMHQQQEEMLERM